MAFATAATESAATAAIAFLRSRHIHFESAATDFRSIQRGNGFVRLGIIAHLDETKSARAAGIAISNDTDTVHCPMRLKCLAQFLFRCRKRQVANKNVFQSDPRKCRAI